MALSRTPPAPGPTGTVPTGSMQYMPPRTPPPAGPMGIPARRPKPAPTAGAAPAPPGERMLFPNPQPPAPIPSYRLPQPGLHPTAPPQPGVGVGGGILARHMPAGPFQGPQVTAGPMGIPAFRPAMQADALEGMRLGDGGQGALQQRMNRFRGGY